LESDKEEFKRRDAECAEKKVGNDSGTAGLQRLLSPRLKMDALREAGESRNPNSVIKGIEYRYSKAEYRNAGKKA
jgi:hypothetical protein